MLRAHESGKIWSCRKFNFLNRETAAEYCVISVIDSKIEVKVAMGGKGRTLTNLLKRGKEYSKLKSMFILTELEWNPFPEIADKNWVLLDWGKWAEFGQWKWDWKGGN